MEAAYPESKAPAVTAAILTPAGRGALAVVGVVGHGAVALVGTLFRPRSGRPLTSPGPALRVGRWGHEAGEEVVVVCHGDDRLEVHCHGGLAAPTAVLDSLVAHGAARVDWRLWLARAGADPEEVELRGALAGAAGPKAARILARQVAGALADDLRLVERCVADGQIGVAAAVLDRLLRAARVGGRLVRPWRVVVTGPVNVGKSSLVNALLGHARCLVSPEPGTTRDLIETRLLLGGWEVELVDTAGQRTAPEGPTERAGIARAAAARAGADLVLAVHDATDPPAGPLLAHPGELLVMTKMDLVPAAGAGPPAGETGTVSPGVVWTSAATGAGIETLADRIVAALVPEDRDPGLLAGGVPCTARQIAAVTRLLESLPPAVPGAAAGSAPPRTATPRETC